MARSIFGWSYPPGAASDPNAPWNQEEGPCEVCLQNADDCVCPECTVCGSVGDSTCYSQHGMEYTQAQRDAISLAESLAQEQEEPPSEDY